MGEQITDAKIDLIQTLDIIPKTPMKDVLKSNNYAPKDIEKAAKLIDKMLAWVPSKRISCKDALKDPFF